MWGKNSSRNRLVPKSFDFLPFWGNSGPVSGQKVSFFDHCIITNVQKHTSPKSIISTFSKKKKKKKTTVQSQVVPHVKSTNYRLPFVEESTRHFIEWDSRDFIDKNTRYGLQDIH